jgi:hypothetical protein
MLQSGSLKERPTWEIEDYKLSGMQYPDGVRWKEEVVDNRKP